MNDVFILLLLAFFILLGYLGHIFFDKTGIPYFLLLIFIGLIVNIFNIFERDLLIPIVELFSTLTLIMVTFYSGLNLDIVDIVTQSWRAFLQSALYILVSVFLIGYAAHIILGWSLIHSLIFSSMTGGEVTAAVIVPLAFKLGVSERVKALLTLETAISTVITIVLFFTFLNQWISGYVGIESIIPIISNFTVAIVVGSILSIMTIKIIHKFRKREYTYVLTIGLLLMIYTVVKALGGNGELAALMLGLLLSNDSVLSKIVGREGQLSLSLIIYRLNEIQDEISFLFETMFFVFLGLVFIIEESTIISNLLIAGLFTIILIITRYIAVSIANWGTEVYEYRSIITVLCAQGIVPATLSIYLLRYNLPLKYTFMSLITYIIILTNMITTVGVWIIRKVSKF